MNISDKIRQIYDRRPYPFGNGQALKRSSWSLLHEWVDAFGRNELHPFVPRRILVAGCGDGTEAFRLGRQYPGSEIVAVDFSTRSIAVAKRLQARMGKKSAVRFVAADLGDLRLPSRVGGGFDLITCHGVLSYVSGPVRVLRNLARSLEPAGVLYLGVNGSANASTRLRSVLPDLGFDLGGFRDGPRLRGVLGLCDHVLASDGRPRVSMRSAAYLAGDVFGALNRSETLSTWVSYGRRAGLSFRGSLATIGRFQAIAEDGSYVHLMPKSRAEVGGVLERLAPSQFHGLLFSPVPEVNPPWSSRSRLLGWTIAPSRLYDFKLPRTGGKVLDRRRPLRISSAALRLSMEWEMPEWELELLRGGPLRRIMAGLPLSVPFAELSKQIYLLFQLGVLKLVPPGVPPDRSRVRRP